MQVGPVAQPSGAVILVVDGLGASYVYPEHRAYALDGSPVDGAVLFNLTGGGARAVDVQVPVPETTKSHSVLITGNRERTRTISAPPSSTPLAPMATSAWPCWSGAMLCPSCRRWTAFSIWATTPCTGPSPFPAFGPARLRASHTDFRCGGTGLPGTLRPRAIAGYAGLQCLGPGCGSGHRPEPLRPALSHAGERGRGGQRRAEPGSGRLPPDGAGPGRAAGPPGRGLPPE